MIFRVLFWSLTIFCSSLVEIANGLNLLIFGNKFLFDSEDSLFILAKRPFSVFYLKYQFIDRIFDKLFNVTIVWIFRTGARVERRLNILIFDALTLHVIGWLIFAVFLILEFYHVVENHISADERIIENLFQRNFIKRLATNLQEPLIFESVLVRVMIIISFVFANDWAESILELVIMHLLVDMVLDRVELVLYLVLILEWRTF